MKIKGLTMDQITSAAQEAGHFKLDNVRTIGNYHFFVLRMASGTPGYIGKDGERKFTKAEQIEADAGRAASLAWRMRYRLRGRGRMMHGKGPEFGTAVCFHGFRAFMRACFARNPNAIIRTARASYLGSEDFEAKWPGVGSQNIGSQFCPIAYAEACDC